MGEANGNSIPSEFAKPEFARVKEALKQSIHVAPGCQRQAERIKQNVPKT
jgi:hypothetical protein